MTGAFSVQTSEMLGASDLAADAARDLQQELERLTQRWEDIASTWDGRSARAFRPEWDEWTKGAAKVIEALNGTAKLLAQHAYTFVDTDAGSGQNISGA
ncbi:WXG100 family type VII secretion target [Mycobacteroides abscessus]|uniref:WXG100 family type VII secretion target n=1 Tax=Mycobacteroides abscessus TaxID=36809 RepID=UPI000E685B4D|nr:WXG100 family type VII secretion target [Mycobacteroides abscessus]RIU01912.1 WXG100 family type VII secretion target [Mycobacteroides abscessus]